MKPSYWLGLIILGMLGTSIAEKSDSLVADELTSTIASEVKQNYDYLGLSRITGKRPEYSQSKIPENRVSKVLFPSIEPDGINQDFEKIQTDHPHLLIRPGGIFKNTFEKLSSERFFVSLTLFASLGTEIEIGKLRLILLPKGEGRAALYQTTSAIENEEWSPLNISYPIQTNGDTLQCGLRTITFSINNADKTWSFATGPSSFFVYDLKFSKSNSSGNRAKATAPRIKITAGEEGASLMSLVATNENPLFEDLNCNLVPDYFEKIATNKYPQVNPDSLNSLRAHWADYHFKNPSKTKVLAAPSY